MPKFAQLCRTRDVKSGAPSPRLAPIRRAARRNSGPARPWRDRWTCTRWKQREVSSCWRYIKQENDHVDQDKDRCRFDYDSRFSVRRQCRGSRGECLSPAGSKYRVALEAARSFVCIHRRPTELLETAQQQSLIVECLPARDRPASAGRSSVAAADQSTGPPSLSPPLRWSYDSSLGRARDFVARPRRLLQGRDDMAAGKRSPNIGSPLRDSARVASS